MCSEGNIPHVYSGLTGNPLNEARGPVKVMQTVGVTSLSTSHGTSGSSHDVAAVRHGSVWAPMKIITAECKVGSTANLQQHVFIIIIITIIRPQSHGMKTNILSLSLFLPGGPCVALSSTLRPSVER